MATYVGGPEGCVQERGHLKELSGGAAPAKVG